MTQVTEAYEWRGREIVDNDGDKIGSLEEIYLDTESGRPEWATVNTGLFGTKQSFIPLAEAEPARGKIVVPYSKNQVKDAPSVDPDAELSAEEEESLYAHYGVADSASGSALTRMLLMSPNARVPDARASASAAAAASRCSSSCGASRRAAISPRIHCAIDGAGGMRPRRNESSRCVCALMRPGRRAV